MSDGAAAQAQKIWHRSTWEPGRLASDVRKIFFQFFVTYNSLSDWCAYVGANMAALSQLTRISAAVSVSPIN